MSGWIKVGVVPKQKACYALWENNINTWRAPCLIWSFTADLYIYLKQYVHFIQYYSGYMQDEYMSNP